DPPCPKFVKDSGGDRDTARANRAGIRPTAWRICASVITLGSLRWPGPKPGHGEGDDDSKLGFGGLHAVRRVRQRGRSRPGGGRSWPMVLQAGDEPSLEDAQSAASPQ